MNNLKDIIIVEDSKTQALLLENILKSAGYNVVVFNDGLEAVEYLSNEKNTVPQIIITDINMPNMDGYQLTQHIKTNYPDISVLMLTLSND
jgi:CheY-like chemotaxis protein